MFSILLPLALLACSDSESDPTSDGTGGGGGEGGNGGGSGGDGGQAGDGAGGSPEGGGGSGGEAGQGEAGQAGEAGEAGAAGAGGMPPSAGMACSQCGQSECAELIDACRLNPECAPWLVCLEGCDDANCLAACDQAHVDSERIILPIYACVCSECETECAAASPCEKQCSDASPLEPVMTAPGNLAETGLYVPDDDDQAGAATAALAPYVREFQPQHELWSDGAVKLRYIYLPGCATIDSDDMDHWSFPVGTRLWKQFTVENKVVETRLIHRFGQGSEDWLFAVYHWDELAPADPAAALSVTEGVVDANGTAHDIPALAACTNCHGRLPEKVLGFSAIQLSHSLGGQTIELISHQGWLSTPAAAGFVVPGNEIERAALGYLHGNCGNCHNQSGLLPPQDPMLLRLLVAQTTVAGTHTYQTTVGKTTVSMRPELMGKPRIDPMNPANSTVLLRMQNRSGFGMPPVASEIPDTEGGIVKVTAWVNTIPAAQ